jgi:hypothetical protein
MKKRALLVVRSCLLTGTYRNATTIRRGWVLETVETAANTP